MALLSLRTTLAGVRHVDHHAHSVLRAAPTDLDGFRGLFSESADPRQWPTALEVNRDTGDSLPVQIHTGFGDADLLLPRADPGLLKPLFERFPEKSFVLLHCYPFVRQAGWLASVYANVFFDLSLAIPHVSRPAAVLAEAVELAPLVGSLHIPDKTG